MDSPPAKMSRSSLDPAPPLPPKRQRTVGPAARQNQLLELACHYLSNDQSQTQTQSDGTPAIAKAWGEKLLTLEGTQRIYAEKAINDVLFEASFGNLDRNSVSITVKKSRNSPTSYRYSPSPPKNIHFNDNELFGMRMNAGVADAALGGKQDRFPCGDDDKQHEATGTAEELATVSGVTEDIFKHTEAPDDEDFFDPADMYAMFEANEPQHGDISKPELNTQSKSTSDVQAISSVGTVETGAVAVGAPTSHETAYGDADAVHPEVFGDPVTAPVDIHGDYEITEIIETDSTYQQVSGQQPFMLLIQNPHIPGENNYIVVTADPEYQPTESQEMDSSSNIDQSLATYFQNFTA